MTEADLLHLEDDSAPISDDERKAAAACIRRLQAENGRLRAQVQFAEIYANRYAHMNAGAAP